MIGRFALVLLAAAAGSAGCITTGHSITFTPDYARVGTPGTATRVEATEDCGGLALLFLPYGDAGFANAMGRIRAGKGEKIVSVWADWTTSFYLVWLTRCLTVTATLVYETGAAQAGPGKPEVRAPPPPIALPPLAPPPPSGAAPTCKKPGNVTVSPGASAAEIALDVSDYMGCRGVVELADGRKVIGRLQQIDGDMLIVIETDGKQRMLELTRVKTLGAIP